MRAWGMFVYWWRMLPALAAFLSLSACLPAVDIPDYYRNVLSLKEYYDKGYQDVANSRFRSAISTFRLMEQHYPYSSWSARGRLLLAYSHYRLRQCSLTEAVIDGALELYPLDLYVPYARYLRAQCYFEEISDVRIDRRQAERAYTLMLQVAREHPDTPYGVDAVQKARYAFNHLAAKEMSVGRFQQRSRFYAAALIRYQRVVEEYSTSDQMPEALFRQVECFLQLGLLEEAREQLALLNSNYPASVWYRYGYDLAKNQGLIAQSSPPEG